MDNFLFPEFFEEDRQKVQNKVHLRVFQRSSKRYVTTIEGLDGDLNFKKILKFLKKTFSCNGNIKTQEEGKIIQLSGDQRENVKEFLINEKICDKDDIILHGF